MKILDFLCREAVTVDLAGTTKKEIIYELVELLAKAKKVSAGDKVAQSLLDREKLGSTGIGQGIAIPHGKSDMVEEVVAAFGISKKGAKFDSLDDEPVYLIFLLVAPLNAAGAHLQALARISRLLKDKFFRQSLRNAASVEEVIRIISEEDKY